MKYEIIITSAFRKKLKLIKKRNKNINKLKEVIDALSKGEQLDVKHKDHALFNDGKFKDCRECHIEPDWLLVYKINKKNLFLILIDTGSHGDLF